MARRSKKRDEHLKRCRQRIHGAIEWRKTEGLDDLWGRLNDLYRGKHFNKPLSGEDRIAINLAFSTINVIEPSIAINYPKVTVAARKPEDEDRATIVEAVANYWWRTHEVRPEFRRAVKDMLIYGFGWIKTGYRFVEEEADRDEADIEADYESEYEKRRAEVDDFAVENADMAGELATDEELDAEIRANLAYTELNVVEDRPFVERVSPHDIFVDPEATSPEDMRWIAQRCIKDREEVENNPAYNEAARKKVEADGVVVDTMRPKDVSHREKDIQRITVWEYYDLRNGTLSVFAEKGDGFLVDPQPQPYAFGHPFIMLRNYEVPETFYPMGELEAVEDLQQELNKTRTQQMNDRKRYARKYLYDPRAFDAKAVGDLQSQRDGVFVAVNEGIDLKEAVIPLPQEALDPQFYAASEQIEADINTISGVSEYQRGGGEQAIRRTATEASIIQDAANARAANKLAIVEDGIAKVSRRLITLAQQYMTEAQVGRIVDSNGAPVWFEFEPSWLKGEYDFEVEGGSTQPNNEMLRRQQALDMLNALAPYGDPAMGLLNMQELLKHALQFGFGLKNPSKFLGPGPMVDPMTGMPMAPGGGPQGAPPQGGGPQPGQEEGQEPEQHQIPPEVLAQLQGQVGLDLPSFQQG